MSYCPVKVDHQTIFEEYFSFMFLLPQKDVLPDNKDVIPNLTITTNQNVILIYPTKHQISNSPFTNIFRRVHLVQHHRTMLPWLSDKITLITKVTLNIVVRITYYIWSKWFITNQI